MPFPARTISQFLICFSLGIGLGWPFGPTTQAQEIWEYTPYKVCIWFALDPSLDLSQPGKDALVRHAIDQLESTVGPAWQITAESATTNILSLVERNLDQLTIDDFINRDLVMVVPKEAEATKTLRVLETAAEQLTAIGIVASDRAQLETDCQPYSGRDKTADLLLQKATKIFASYEELSAALKASQVDAVLIPRSRLAELADQARMLASQLPWHAERTFRDYEKLFVVHVARSGEAYDVAARELDCPMRLFGPTMRDSTANANNLSQVVSDRVVHAFAPVARIEEANGKLVKLHNRAGGLIGADSPAHISPGDVLQPVIRREDRRGVATLLEPIPWTYIAVTSTDGINLEGTVLSALGNILQGKQTRRAQRVALRVRPTGTKSDIKIVVRGDETTAQAGCQVYQRDLLTEELLVIGQTDWRGMITINRADPLGGILPESVRLKRAEARRKAAEAAAQAAAEAEAKAAAAKAADKKDATSPDDQDVRGSEAEPSAQPKIDTPAAVPAGELPGDQLQVDDAEYTAASVPLKQPLVLLYIKSGDTVMARLPVVPGLNAIDIADLPSDTRRLEAEAVLRGFQGEILDLIGKRALLGSRIAKFIGGGKFSEAEESLNELRLLKDYKTMADILDGIQRRALDESKEPVPMAAKSRIDRMTQSTRDMLQKYLENDLAGKLDRDLKKAQAAPPPKKENADASDNGKSSDAAKPVGDAKSSSSES